MMLPPMPPLNAALTGISLILHLCVFTSPIKAQSIITVTAPPSAQPTSPSYATPEAFQSQVLGYTNLYRAEYNASALTWNATLAKFAQQWSDKCVFEHSSASYGENLAEGYSNVSASIGAWANESQYYDFNTPTGFSEQTGHFTQLVWKSTTEVGCGVTNCPEGSSSDGNAAQGWYVVCEYQPAGNIVGDNNLWFKENVDPPINLGVGTFPGEQILVTMVHCGVMVVLFNEYVF